MPGGLHPPAEVVTSWPKLNAIDPERKNWSLVIHTIVLFTITLFVVCARFWARCKVQRNAGLDDALIAVAMVPLLGLAISTCLSSRYYGFDRHIWDLTVSQASESRRAVMAMEVFYILTTGPIKISILCFYRRLSTGTISTKFIWTVWLSIASVIGYMVAFMIALFATCRPIDAYWNFMDPAWTSKHEYTCADEAAILFSAVIISMIQDIITCVLPIWFVWNLQLAKRQKIAVAGIFLVGFLTCIAGALRMYYIHRVYYETYDITWAAEEGWLWTMIESHLGIICASAPALKIFFARVLKVASNGSSFGTRYMRSFNDRDRDRNPERGTYTAEISRACSDAGVKRSRSRLRSKPKADEENQVGIKVSRGLEIRVESGDGYSEQTSTSRSSIEFITVPLDQDQPPLPCRSQYYVPLKIKEREGWR